MPTIFIHEEVAYQIAQKYIELDNSNFYLGALAPDAINVDGFACREERFNSHLRNIDLNIWLDNVVKFYKDNKDKYNNNFLLGYLTHIITDIIYDKYFYWKVRGKMKEDGILDDEQHDLLRINMLEYGYQNENNEFWLYVKEKLKDVCSYDIQNIKKEKLLTFKNKCFLKQQSFKSKNKYITKGQVKELANFVEEELINLNLLLSINV